MSPAARTTRRRHARAVALAGVTVAATGCTVANSRHGGYDPNTLRIVLPQEPPTLEPCESSLTSTGIVVRSNITEPLIERDPTSGDLQPLLSTGGARPRPTSGPSTSATASPSPTARRSPPRTPRSPSTGPSTPI